MSDNVVPIDPEMAEIEKMIDEWLGGIPPEVDLEFDKWYYTEAPIGDTGTLEPVDGFYVYLWLHKHWKSIKFYMERVEDEQGQ